MKFFWYYVFSLLSLFVMSGLTIQGETMEMSSPAFTQGDPIPKKYSCQGLDLSPELIIKGIPNKTKSLALILEDPDAPSGTFDHWIAWNISPETDQIKEGVKLSHQGINGFGKKGYGGPCPPIGKKHRYYFRLYALDVELQLPEGSSKAKLLDSMKGHLLEKAELMGTYQKE